MNIEELLEATKGAGKDNPELKEFNRLQNRIKKSLRKMRGKKAPSKLKEEAEAAKRKEEAAKRKEEKERLKREEERKKRIRETRRRYRLRHYDPVKAKEYRKKHPVKRYHIPGEKAYTLDLPKALMTRAERYAKKIKTTRKAIIIEALTLYLDKAEDATKES